MNTKTQSFAVALALAGLVPSLAQTPPTITTQPTNQSVSLGATASFRVTAGGSVPLSFQWRKDDVSLRDGGYVSGVRTSTLTLSNVVRADEGGYSVLISNTFLFYERGHRGVLVEPNVTMCEKLKAVRPRDLTLNAGIGLAAAKEADYYVMSEPSWSTFDKPRLA